MLQEYFVELQTILIKWPASLRFNYFNPVITFTSNTQTLFLTVFLLCEEIDTEISPHVERPAEFNDIISVVKRGSFHSVLKKD